MAWEDCDFSLARAETWHELIDAVVEMKRRNRTWGCKRIAQQVGLAFGLDIDKDVVRRILGIHFRKLAPEVRCGFPFLVMPKTRCGHWICFDVNRRCYERTVISRTASGSEVVSISEVPYCPTRPPQNAFWLGYILKWRDVVPFSYILDGGIRGLVSDPVCGVVSRFGRVRDGRQHDGVAEGGSRPERSGTSSSWATGSPRPTKRTFNNYVQTRR